MTRLTRDQIQERIEKSPFPEEAFFSLTREALGKGLSIKPTINPFKALERPEFFEGVYNHLLRGHDKSNEVLEELLISNGPSVLAELAQNSVELSLLQYGKYQADKIRQIVQQQLHEFGVVSPVFAYDDLDLAANWRWVLINENIGMRNILEVVNWDKEFESVEVLLDLVQLYINAAGFVMERHHGVSDASGYRTKNMKDCVRNLVWEDTSRTNEVYRNLLIRVANTMRRAVRDLTEDEQANLAKLNKRN